MEWWVRGCIERYYGNIQSDIGGGWEESSLICCLRRCTVMFGRLKGIARNLAISFSDLFCKYLADLHIPRYKTMKSNQTCDINFYLFNFIYSRSARISAVFLGFESSPLKSSLNNNRSTCLRLLSLSLSIPLAVLEKFCVVWFITLAPKYADLEASIVVENGCCDMECVNCS